MELGFTVQPIVILSVEGGQASVVGLVLVLLNDAQIAVWHEQTIWQNEVFGFFRLHKFRTLFHVVSLHVIYELSVIDVILVMHFLRLQIYETHKWICYHELSFRVEENAASFRACQPGDFLITIQFV